MPINKIMSHTVKWEAVHNDQFLSFLDEADIRADIELGVVEGEFYKGGDTGNLCKWFIIDWKEIADKLYKAINRHTYQDIGTKDLIEAVKLYEDATGK